MLREYIVNAKVLIDEQHRNVNRQSSEILCTECNDVIFMNSVLPFHNLGFLPRFLVPQHLKLYFDVAVAE